MKKLLNKYERERFVYQKKQIDIKNKLNYCKNNLAKFNYNMALKIFSRKCIILSAICAHNLTLIYTHTLLTCLLTS